MVECGDWPKGLPSPKFSDFGKTAGLLLCLMQCIHHTAKYIVLDSGLCVLAALVALKRISVFAGALIKKHHYWMSLVPGHTINNQCDEQEVGSVAAVQGDLDVVRYNIWAMKDAGYMTKSMGTASRLFYTNDH